MEGGPEERVSACLRRIRDAQGALDDARRVLEGDIFGQGAVPAPASAPAPMPLLEPGAALREASAAADAAPAPPAGQLLGPLAAQADRRLASKASREALAEQLPGIVNSEAVPRPLPGLVAASTGSMNSQA
ncbi:unnamed protein product, partial [Prorocentrum cordatum]